MIQGIGLDDSKMSFLSLISSPKLRLCRQDLDQLSQVYQPTFSYIKAHIASSCPLS